MPRRAIGAAQPAAQPAQPAAHPAAQQPPDHLPSPPGLTFNTVVVQPEGTNGLTVPKFLLPDGRNGRRPLVTFVPQRFVEIVLFNRFDGGSSGAVYKILNLNGLGPTAWTINTAAVVYNELSQAHATFIFDRYKEHLPTNGDPVLANRMRNVTLLPIATVAAVCRIRGRSPGTTAFLRACAPNQLPRSWEIEEEAETLEDNEHDLILVDRLQEAEDAEADVAPSFEAELRAGSFSSFNQKAADEKTARAYALTPAQLGAKIKKEADVYIAFRVSPLEARRASTAVAETTTQADLQSYYRFLGYLRLKQLLPLDVHPSFEVLLHPSAPHWVAGYVDFMKGERGLAFSSMANYINSLFGLATYVFDSDDFDSDSAAGANHTVLDALVNLRSQCESLAKEAGLYAEKRGGWMKWEDAQKARVKCLERLQAYTDTDVHFRKQLLMDAIVITIFTYGPVDRVGVIRKLRVNDTLVRGADGSYSVDLTKAMRSHKSAKYHGGTKHKLPALTWPLIDKLCRSTEFDLLSGDKYYLFHNVRTRDALRPLTEGPFGTWVKKLFGKYAGVEVVPKNLRSIFIVWLKDQDDASQRILDASATAMRHHPNTQASLSYDIETNNRQIALANEYASRFASQFQPTASSSAAGGGSSSAAGAADDADDDQELTEGADDEEEAPSATPFAEGEELGDAWHAIYGFGAAPTEAEVRGFLQANPAFLDRVVASESALFIGPVKETLQKVALEMVKGLAAQQGRDTDDEMADAVRASIRSNFIEANMGVMPDELPPLAAQARETLARSNVPLPGEGDTANELSTAAQLAAGAPEQRATSAISELSLTADGTLEPEHEPQPAAAPAAPLRPTKRAAKPPARLELGEGAASRWKTPRVTPASVPAQPQPMANEWSDGGFIAGDQVEAVGRGPSGAREWFKATVNKIRAPTAWPPITVKFTATLDGMTTRLALPEPVTAYVHADDVRRPEA